MANLDQFISTVKSGMQMAYNYDVQFIGGSGSSDKLSLLCEEVTVPGMTFASNPVFTYGEAREVVYNRVFEPATFTFLVDSKSTALKFFRGWMDKIINPNTRLAGYYNSYTGTVIIKHLNSGDLAGRDDTQRDVEKKKVYEVYLREAYPKSIQSYTLSNNTKDIVRYSVTMNYKYWDNNTAPTGNLPERNPRSSRPVRSNGGTPR